MFKWYELSWQTSVTSFAGSCILADVRGVGCSPHHEPHEICSCQQFHRCNRCSNQHGLLCFCSSCVVSSGFWIQALQTNIHVNLRCRSKNHIMWTIHYGLLIQRRETADASLRLKGHLLCATVIVVACGSLLVCTVYIELYAAFLNTIVFLSKILLSWREHLASLNICRIRAVCLFQGS